MKKKQDQPHHPPECSDTRTAQLTQLMARHALTAKTKTRKQENGVIKEGLCVDMYGTRSGALRRGNGVVWGQLKALSKTRTLLIVRDARSLVAQLATPIFICIFLVLSQVLTNYILAASDPNPVSSPLPRVCVPSIARVRVSL
jgi:hypothetical protein